MNERWVCKRCYADNESVAMNCVRCGLTRGADVTAADQAAWQQVAGAPPAGAPQSPARRLLRFWWIPVVGAALLIGLLVSARRDEGGSITGGGSLSVDELRVGDCFNASEDEEEIDRVDARPCTEPHLYEVFHVATHTAGGEYPGDAAMETFFLTECAPAFATYVGEPYATSVLYGTMITPTESGWSAGDRSFTCILYEPGADPNGPPRQVSASQRGAAR